MSILESIGVGSVVASLLAMLWATDLNLVWFRKDYQGNEVQRVRQEVQKENTTASEEDDKGEESHRPRLQNMFEMRKWVMGFCKSVQKVRNALRYEIADSLSRAFPIIGFCKQSTPK